MYSEAEMLNSRKDSSEVQSCLCGFLLLLHISCTSSLWAARTRAQTITVIMENHVILWRKRPADWLTAGVPEGLMYKQQRDTEAGGGRKSNDEEGKKHTRKQKGEGFTSHPLSSKSHLRLHSALVREIHHPPPPLPD